MQKVLSNSVKISFLNYNKIMTNLQDAANKLLKRNFNVLRIILFGSLVKGNYGPGSDADILIVLSSDSRRRIDRIPEFLGAFSEVPVSVDVFPLTEEELHQALNNNNFFYNRAVKEGIELGKTP